MKRYELEKLYLENGLSDFKLKTIEDLLKTHGINSQQIKGYKGLTDEHKAIFDKFIINIFNAFGLESRATLKPKGIYYVEDTDYLVKENPEDEHFLIAGGIVKSEDKFGNKKILREWKDEDYTHLQMKESESKHYLRFEYSHQRRNEWLHVVNEKNWY